VLAVLEEPDDRPHVFDRQICLAGDMLFTVATAFHAFDVM
jgi:hypothetical protein